MSEDSSYGEAGAFAGWELRDPLGTRVGRVSRVFVDDAGRAAQVEVALGPFGIRTVLLPVDGVRVDREDRTILLLGKGRTRPGNDGATTPRTIAPGEVPRIPYARSSQNDPSAHSGE